MSGIVRIKSISKSWGFSYGYCRWKQ